MNVLLIVNPLSRLTNFLLELFSNVKRKTRIVHLYFDVDTLRNCTRDIKCTFYLSPPR